VSGWRRPRFDEAASELHEQIAFADRCLLNKMDLLRDGRDSADADGPSRDSGGSEGTKHPRSDNSSAAAAKIEAAVRALNPRCEVVRCSLREGADALDLASLLSLHAFRCDGSGTDTVRIADAIARAAPGCAPAPRRDVRGSVPRCVPEDGVVTAVTVRTPPGRSVALSRFNLGIGMLLNDHGARLIRVKGLLNVRGSARRHVFQAVHMVFDGRPGALWKEGEERRSVLVFIGRLRGAHELSRARLQKFLDACCEDDGAGAKEEKGTAGSGP
jgi:G3E family GTPase